MDLCGDSSKNFSSDVYRASAGDSSKEFIRFFLGLPLFFPTYFFSIPSKVQGIPAWSIPGVPAGTFSRDFPGIPQEITVGIPFRMPIEIAAGIIPKNPS